MTTCEASIVKTHKLISCNRIINSDQTRLTQSRRRSSRDICYGKQTDRRVGSSVISAVCVCRIGAAMVRLSPCHHTYVWDMEQLDVAEGRNGSDWHRWRKKFPLGRCQMTNTHWKKKSENVYVCVGVFICVQVSDVFNFWQIFNSSPTTSLSKQGRRKKRQVLNSNSNWVMRFPSSREESMNSAESEGISRIPCV